MCTKSVKSTFIVLDFVIIRLFYLVFIPPWNVSEISSGSSEDRGWYQFVFNSLYLFSRCHLIICIYFYLSIYFFFFFFFFLQDDG